MLPVSMPCRDTKFAVISHRVFNCLRKLGSGSILGLVLVATTCGAWASAQAQGGSATATTLTVTSGGGTVTTVGAWSVVTLTATVKAGATAVTAGQVNFCDATAQYCTDVRVLGTAQLTSAGTAVFKFRPAPGAHQYKAVFTGTNTSASSSSVASALTVSISGGQSSAATLLSSTGSWGSYALTSTVEEFGGTTPLTGNISFEDTSNGNAVLATAPLGASTPGLFWALQAPCSMNNLSPTSTVAADFNSDGYLDVAVLEGRSQLVAVFVYQPTQGCYQQIASYPTGPSPSGIVVADFNSDGNLDLAIPDEGNNTLTLLLGNGDGTFTQSTVSVGSTPNSVVAGDFNGDGIPDLAIGNWYNGVTILLGKGDGTFTSGTSLSLGSQNEPTPVSVTAGDFNGDGKLDLAIPTSTGVTVYLGNGDGTFSSNPVSTTLSVPNYADMIGLVTADFNRDGNLDLAVSFGRNVVPESGQVLVLLGNGDGTFTATTPSTTPDAPVQLAVADFNLDGIPDIAVLDLGGNITVLVGLGDGTFAAPAFNAKSAEPIFFQSFAVGDMDGDGRPDLLYAGEYPPNSIAMYFGLTRPMQTASTASVAVDPTGTGQHLVVASYPGDATATAGTSNPVSLWGTPPATTTSLAMTANGSAASTVPAGTPVTLTATVISGGSKLTTGQVSFCDASASYCTDQYLLGSSQLTASGSATYKFIPGPGNHSYKAVFQIDGNGAASTSSIVLLTVSGISAAQGQTSTTIAQSGMVGDYSLTATVAGSGSTAALTGNVSFLDTSYSNGVLATAAMGASAPGLNWNSLSSTSFSNVYSLKSVSGDFNGDGIPDLAVVNQNSMTVTILLGNGDGTFKTIAGPTITTYTTTIVVGDFNGDGKADLVVSSYDPYAYAPGSMTVFLGNGDGTFTAGYSTTGPGNLFATADFNGDGKLDLLVNQESSGAVILLGNGDGTFTQPMATGIPAALAVADLNGDGIPDLVVSFVTTTNGYNSTVTQAYLGNGDGTFRAGSNLPLSEAFSNMAVGDFNGDGIADLAGTSTFFASPVVFLGNGDGTFTQASTGSFPNSGDGNPSSIVAADLNHDGKLDIVITNGNSYSYPGYVNTYNPDFEVLLGNGDGTFNAVGANTTLGSTAYAVVGDFNGDGKPELAMQAGRNLVVLQPVPTMTATATATGVSPTGPAPHLVAGSYPGDSNYAASFSGTTSLNALAATPVISPASGTITSAQSITITDATPGVTIYYQTSGASYTNGVYTGPIPIEGSGTLTVQAYATGTGYQQSGYATATYSFNFPPAQPPVFSLAPGVYPNTQTVTISDSTPGATIVYQTNGTILGLGQPYTGPITVSTSETLLAYAIAPGFSYSAGASAQYIIDSSSSSFIYTIAGNGIAGYSGDGGAATQANVNRPEATVVDGAGNLYIADSENNVVRKVAAGTGVITTIAGTGTGGYSSDNGQATSAKLLWPTQLALDNSGILWIRDSGNGKIRTVDTAGTIRTVPMTGVALQGFALYGPQPILYVLSSNEVLRVQATGATTLVAGGGYQFYSGDNGPATSASLNYPQGIAFDGAGNLYIADTNNSVIRKVTKSTGIITTVAGDSIYEAQDSYGYGYGPEYGGGVPGYTGDGGPATSAQLRDPYSIAVDGAGNLYIADTDNNAIREVSASTGIIYTVAGNGGFCQSFGGDGGPATSASLCVPVNVAIDIAGNLYVAGSSDSRIREVTAPGPPPTATTATPVLSVAPGSYSSPQTVTITDATPGTAIYVTMIGGASSAGNGASTPAQLLVGPGYYSGPIGVTGTTTIEAIAVAPGFLPSAGVTAAYTIATPPVAVISTVAGSGAYGFSGNGGPATSAAFEFAQGLAVDGTGNLYFADSQDNVVWKVSAGTGNIAVIAGNGTRGYKGNGGPAANAELYSPSAVALDSSGNVYIADTGNNVIRMVTANTGEITTVAGIGGEGYPWNYGDGGPATSAYLGNPSGVALDSIGNLYIADSSNNAIRKVTASTGTIATIAGGTYLAETAANNGDGGPATNAVLNYPQALTTDSAGNLYISDADGGRVRMVTAKTGIITTVAGDGDYGYNGDGGLAINAEVNASGLATDAAGNIYLSNQSNTVRKVAAATGMITTVAGNGFFNYNGDGISATVAGLSDPQGIAVDGAGNIYIADSAHYRIRKVTYPGPAPTPSFSVEGGTYRSVQTVSITDSIAGATIYYTTDGSSPTTDSSVYSGAITVSASETLGAIAVATGYTESAPATATYTIDLPVTPAITWAAPAPIVYGTALSATQLDASTNVGGTFAYVPAAGAVLGAGPQTLSTTFTPADLADYTSANATTSMTVNQATPTCTWATPAAISYGTALGSSQLNAACSWKVGGITTPVAGSFVYTPAAGAMPGVGAQTLSATFTPADTTDYTSATVTVTLTVNKATPAITWAAPAAIAYGTALGAAQLDAASSVAGSFVYTPATGAVMGVGSQTLSATFTPADSADYTAATAAVTLTVNKAMPAVAVTASANPAYVSSSVTFTATASSGTGTPTGTVTFFDGTTQLGPGALTAGLATYTTSALTAGVHSIMATYGGDTNFGPLTSTALAETIEDFTLVPPGGGGTPSDTISPGGQATYTLAIDPPAGGTFAGPITFSVTGLPAGATATFSPATVAAGSGAVNLTLTVSVPATNAALPIQRPFGGGALPIALGLILLPFSSRLRKTSRSLNKMLCLLLCGLAGAALAAGLAGCGGRSSSSTQPSNPQTYTLTITATSGTLSHSTTATLIVQ